MIWGDSFMKCQNCGNEVDENEEFCPNCGEEIHHDNASSPDDIKSKLLFYWNGFDLLEKVICVSIAAAVLLLLLAMICGKPGAGSFALFSIIMFVITLLIKNDVIKVPDKRSQWLALAAAFVFLFFYSTSFRSSKEVKASFNWNEVVLKDALPKPESKTGTIESNTKSYLSVDINDTTAPAYYDYVDACKDTGYEIEPVEDDLSYEAYNDDGYKLSLYYYESDKQMNISLEAGMELGELEWPDSTLANMIPSPDSKTGNIETDTESRFSAYVGETSLDAYSTYINKCMEKGFIESTSQTEKSFSARNTDGYKLTVDYRGNEIIHILVEEPQYTANIEIQCDENLIFSQYDVEVYADDELLGTIDHGSNETYSPVLKKGTHLIQFISADDSTVTGEVEIDLEQDEEYLFKIHCYSTNISIKTMKGTLSEAEQEKQATEEPTEETEEAKESESASTEQEATATPEPTVEATEEPVGNITPENNEDLAKLLTVSDYDYYTEFAKKYKGKTIEFDASIDDFFANSKWNYDILLTAGDYSETEVHGPSFKFDDVSRMTYDTDLSYLYAGINVHIVAKVEEFDDNTGLFFLEAEVINGR